MNFQVIFKEFSSAEKTEHRMKDINILNQVELTEVIFQYTNNFGNSIDRIYYQYQQKILFDFWFADKH